ncbi:MAG: hypothetical protein M3Y73_11040 [Actinomycetota bacterium]|nr:hypothetical protein [Actinomycetota bacterium]
MGTAAVVVAIVLSLHILIKFSFFLLPYRRRRAELDRAYGDRLSATKLSDLLSLLIVVVVAVVLFTAGVQVPSFLIGLWCGATLIQLYFHEFHDPLTPDRAPPEPAGPIKTMSYAIQASPWQPWRELALIVALIIAAFVALIA